MRNTEPKKVSYNFGKVELYHNTVQTFHLNNSGTMCAQGVGDNQRVGDQVNSSGYRLKMLFGQKGDRENVTFKLWFVKVPKGSAYSYANWFDPVTNNIMLDDVNEDFVKVVKVKHIKYNVALDAGDEFTFTRTVWIPYRKVIKFGPPNAALTTSDPFDFYMLVGVYDAYGTLVTDNIAYLVLNSAMHYRDP